MPRHIPDPVPHHYELLAYKTTDPDEIPHRSNISETVDGLIEYMLLPILDGMNGKLVMHAKWLKSRGYKFWEIRPVFLTPRQLDALWSQKVSDPVYRQQRDYD